MTFLGTIAGLLFALLICHTTGWRLARLAPWRLRPIVQLWLAPVLGAAAWLIFTVPIGWFGPGMAHPVVRLILFLAATISLATAGNPAHWLPSYARIAVFALIATFPFTVQLLRYGAFDTLNDPWTYMIQSQWFQQHGLNDIVPLDNLHGAQTQVYFTQVTGTRVGAQFLFASIQSMLGLRWPHQAYPIVLCLGYAAGALATAFAASIAGGKNSGGVATISGLLLALSHNGFTLGALRGFLPQTFGLSFGAASCLLGGWIIGHSSNLAPSARAKGALLAAILLAGAAYSYSELLPFLALGCVAMTIFQGLSERKRLAVAQTAGATAIGFLVLTGPEIPRALRALAVQAKSIVGCGIPWNPVAFATHALGGRTGFTDGGVFLGGSQALAYLAVALVATLAVTGCRRSKRMPLSAIAAALLVVVIAFFLLFLYFRYRVPSPFSVGNGQSWSQYKLASWSSIFVFGLSAVGLGRMRRLGLLAVVPLVLFVEAAGLIDAWRLADFRTQPIRHEVGRDRDPFQALVEFAAEVQTLAHPPVFIDLPSGHAKSQQLLAYALPVGYCIADWADDPFVNWMLPLSERYADRSRAHFAIGYKADNEAIRSPIQIANYVAGEYQQLEFRLLEVTSPYGTEQSPGGSLNWVRDTASYEFLRPNAATASATVEADIISIIPALEFSITVSSGGKSETQTVKMPESLDAWAHPPRLRTTFALGGMSRALIVTFRTRVHPRIISDTDRREVTFLVRNLRLWIDSPPQPDIQH